MTDKKILLGLTTTAGSDWQDKVAEIKKLEIKEAALLPAGLDFANRKVLYKMLQATPLASVPFCQLCDDVIEEEIEYLMAKYKTKVFSCPASQAGFNLISRFSKHSSLFYMQNLPSLKENLSFNQEMFDRYQVAGLCLDLANLESQLDQNKASFKKFKTLVEEYQLGANLISPVSKTGMQWLKKTIISKHLNSLAQLDYIKTFPSEFFAKLVVMELENSLVEQVEIQKYLEEVVK